MDHQLARDQALTLDLEALEAVLELVLSVLVVAVSASNHHSGAVAVHRVRWKSEHGNQDASDD
jgi:hypothetical protein